LGQQAKGHPEKTVMLSLFQPAESGRRLFELFTDALNEHYNRCPRRKWFGKHRVVFKYVFQIYSPSGLFVGALLTFGLLLRIAQLRYGHSGTLVELVPLLKPSGMEALLYVLITSIALVVWWILNVLFELKKDIRDGIVKNDLGLCRGSSQEMLDGKPISALIEWIHEAIQRGAGLSIEGPPLTFEDLWNAPLWPVLRELQL